MPISHQTQWQALGVAPLSNGGTSGMATTFGSDAQATPLHSKASSPALFQPGVGQFRAIERRSGCAWVRAVNTPR